MSFLRARSLAFNRFAKGKAIGTLPVAVSDLLFHRRFSGGPLGGQGGLRIEAHSHYRPSDEGGDLNADGIADGRDLARLSFAGGLAAQLAFAQWPDPCHHGRGQRRLLRHFAG